ncbi:hypothetical protein ASD12_11920 [Mesorhizobium sp. Root102]|uniref:NAD(P)-dependent oxidoreductase n=1 Tax=Mesorhizobium sp. Root102 TaxID=1736422 RepID=UPI0006F246BD|nr:NAD(P)-dependent oxidoreductase [Mesorhizobium sp. Root102]KQU80107.1 hypothetical protein ASD12_11920 [Mesorhizobium sp. Root102]
MSGTICIIGFGEAGTVFASELASLTHVRVYDILRHAAEFNSSLASFQKQGIEFPVSAAQAGDGAKLIVSLVTASSSLDVAREAEAYLQPGQVLLDLNSVSPGTKKASAVIVERTGAIYVDGAVMAPVQPRGLAVPILLAGKGSALAVDLLAGFGMNLEIVADEVGVASATKMCRSVIIKGIEALCSEAFLAARAYGVESRVLSSLHDTFPGIDWPRFAGYQVGRSLVHGRRRAAEMREVSTTMREAGIAPLMSSATALRQDWAADLSDSNPDLKARRDDEWLDTLDLMLAIGSRNDRTSDF